MLHRKILWHALFAVVFFAASLAAEAGVGRQGRWFTYNGQPAYLVGFDLQQVAADPSIDIPAAMQKLADNGINKIRVWVDCWFLGTTGLSPWRRVDGMYDLDAWDDQHYWPRMRTLATEARARNIAIEVTIFAPYPNSTNYWWDKSEWRNAWNAQFNQNGAFASNAAGHFYPEFYRLDLAQRSKSGKTLADYQHALIDKTLHELGSYDNVYFELANEFATAGQGAPNGAIHDAGLRRWQENGIERMNAGTARLVAAHTDADGRGDGLNYWTRNGALDVLNVRFNNVAPEEIFSRLQRSGALASDKILSLNETRGDHDFYRDLDLHTRYAWFMFTAGGHVGFYEDDPKRVLNDQKWVEGAKRLRTLRQVAESVRFWELAPIDARGDDFRGLLKQTPTGNNARVLANPGAEYVLYFWGNKTSTDVAIDMPAHSYSYRWVDVRDGTLLSQGTLASDNKIIPAPANWDPAAGVALVIRRT